MPKTPNFDKELDVVLRDLKPHSGKCRLCGDSFYIYGEDIEFYKKFQVPPPTLCPKHRRERRLSFRNNRNLFRRKCDLTGKEIVSIYRPDSPFKVYEEGEWWGDKWDPMRFGRDYDSSHSFFEQLNELKLEVPRPHLVNHPKNENVRYSNHSGPDKNCYMTFVTYQNEDCMYGSFFGLSKDCMDVYDSAKLELCYENTSCEDSYNCSFCFNAHKSRDSLFLSGCTNCRNCFMSSGLKHKSFVFRNRQLTSEEYSKELKKMDFGSHSQIEKLKAEFGEMMKKIPQRNLLNKACENSVGDRLTRCKDCYMSFGDYESENSRYCTQSGWRKDSMDTDYAGILGELLYECGGGGMSSHLLKFCFLVRESDNVEYSDHCMNCHDCFGCIGLRKKKYCILNKQYSKKDYFELLDKIKCDMLKRKEYGEYFPFAMATFPRIDSENSWFYPRSKESFEDLSERDSSFFDFKIEPAHGWIEPEAIQVPANAMNANEPPDNIKEIDEDILDKVILCEKSGKPFKIIKKELEFYRKMNLPIPREHPDVRDKRRFDLVTVVELFRDKCGKCGKEIDSRYDPRSGVLVYCHDCYNKTIK